MKSKKNSALAEFVDEQRKAAGMSYSKLIDTLMKTLPANEIPSKTGLWREITDGKLAARTTELLAQCLYPADLRKQDWFREEVQKRSGINIHPGGFRMGLVNYPPVSNFTNELMLRFCSSLSGTPTPSTTAMPSEAIRSVAAGETDLIAIYETAERSEKLHFALKFPIRESIQGVALEAYFPDEDLGTRRLEKLRQILSQEKQIPLDVARLVPTHLRDKASRSALAGSETSRRKLDRSIEGSERELQVVVVRDEVGYHHAVNRLGLDPNTDELVVIERLDPEALAAALRDEPAAYVRVILTGELLAYAALAELRKSGAPLSAVPVFPVTTRLSAESCAERRRLPIHFLGMAVRRSESAAGLEEGLRTYVFSEPETTSLQLTELWSDLKKIRLFRDADAGLGIPLRFLEDPETRNRLQTHNRINTNSDPQPGSKDYVVRVRALRTQYAEFMMCMAPSPEPLIALEPAWRGAVMRFAEKRASLIADAPELINEWVAMARNTGNPSERTRRTIGEHFGVDLSQIDFSWSPLALTCAIIRQLVGRVDHFCGRVAVLPTERPLDTRYSDPPKEVLGWLYQQGSEPMPMDGNPNFQRRRTVISQLFESLDGAPANNTKKRTILTYFVQLPKPPGTVSATENPAQQDGEEPGGLLVAKDKRRNDSDEISEELEVLFVPQPFRGYGITRQLVEKWKGMSNGRRLDVPIHEFRYKQNNILRESGFQERWESKEGILYLSWKSEQQPTSPHISPLPSLAV